MPVDGAADAPADAPVVVMLHGFYQIGRGLEQFVPGDEAANIRQPALLLWGRQDAMIDPSTMALFAARMPQARRVLVEDADRMSLMEQPAAVAVAVVQLIQAH